MQACKGPKANNYGMEPASRARPSAETRAVGPRPDKREFDAKIAALNGEIYGVDDITDQRQKKVITTYKTNQADSSSDSSSSAPRGYELDLGQLLRDKL